MGLRQRPVLDVFTARGVSCVWCRTPPPPRPCLGSPSQRPRRLQDQPLARPFGFSPIYTATAATLSLDLSYAVHFVPCPRLLPHRLTLKTGIHSTSEEVLHDLQPQHPLPGIILQHRQLSKLLSGFIQPLTKSAYPVGSGMGLVHTTFLQNGTATGRSSLPCGLRIAAPLSCCQDSHTDHDSDGCPHYHYPQPADPDARDGVGKGGWHAPPPPHTSHCKQASDKQYFTNPFCE